MKRGNPDALYGETLPRMLSNQRMFSIQAYEPSDWVGRLQVLEPVFRAGATYPMSPDSAETEAHAHWIEHSQATFFAVHEADATIIGTYYLNPNSSALGARVCKAGCMAGCMAAEAAWRQGGATAIGRHSLQTAAQMGFRAMQFNLVVSTNEASVRWWRKLGFEVMGALPEAFKHACLGYVDALVMYNMLEPQD